MKTYTDKERLDALQNLSKGYGTGWVVRYSTSGRGLRLHESTHVVGQHDIRKAIDAFLDECFGGEERDE